MNTFAGIVLFNPELDKLDKNINSIINQVNELLLVDNGSENINVICNKYEHLSKVSIIKNDINLGIAAALNQIVIWGVNRGYLWGLTLDQDTICEDTIIKNYSKYIDNKKVAIISPKIYDLNLKDTIKSDVNVEEIFDSENVITSGCLINLNICKQIGMFNERLFIDFVDTDFNQRVLEYGYRILRLNYIKINHEVGALKVYKLGKLKITCSNHSSFRRYYMVRNRLYFKKKYFGTKAFIKEYIRLVLGTIKISILEGDKISKIKASIKGFLDWRKI